jgi:hypothetical protein
MHGQISTVPGGKLLGTLLFGAAYQIAGVPPLQYTSLDFRRRQQKLVQSNRCKTGPGKAVAGRPVASVA